MKKTQLTQAECDLGEAARRGAASLFATADRRVSKLRHGVVLPSRRHEEPDGAA